MADEEVAQAALDRAIEDSDQLLLVYQPIHDARSGEILAAEALLRQRRQSGEIREASIITEAAEAAGGPELYVLDSLLVRKAYTGAARWQNSGYPDIRLNVNLSPKEFQEGNVLARLTDLVTSCGIDTNRINLEITEMSYIDDPEETMEVLVELKKLGIELWLDDFGTGHSSLEHLQHFPLDGLKLPGAFIKDVLTSRRSAAITRALISLAHDVGVKVIAEEVETQEQLDFLLDLECDSIQGFLFSRPMEIDAFVAYLGSSVRNG